MGCHVIPCSIEQGIFWTQQGILSTEQGIGNRRIAGSSCRIFGSWVSLNDPLPIFEFLQEDERRFRIRWRKALGDSAYDDAGFEGAEAATMVRTKPNLNFSAAGPNPRLKISARAWMRVEEAYGYPLDPSVRKKICAVTRQYLQWAELEQSARSSAECARRVCMIKDAARAFRKAILEHSPKISRDADYYARWMICKHMELAFDGRDGLQNLAVRFDRQISTTCDRTLAELRCQESFGFRHGEMWERWIRDLTTIVSDVKLPTQVRKDTDKIKSGKPSPFVSLVRELQTCLPQEYRRSRPPGADAVANIALSTAIVRARARGRVSKLPSSHSE
jgi:hypothetical protein